MTNESHARAIVVMEQDVLQALCRGDSHLLKTEGSQLSGYRWREPIHQIIFTCLSNLLAGGPHSLRERLAECATRKGFPDVDWDDFFSLRPVPTLGAEELIRQLIEAGRTDI
jgi:hypothetical protein